MYRLTKDGQKVEFTYDQVKGMWLAIAEDGRSSYGFTQDEAFNNLPKKNGNKTR